MREVLNLAITVKPETFTELYFEDHVSLPNEVILFEGNTFKFTIHNLENKDMEYSYEVYIEVNGEIEPIDKRSVWIKKNEYMTITEEFNLSIPIQRARVVVRLMNKNQQIHFWIREGMLK